MIIKIGLTSISVIVLFTFFLSIANAQVQISQAAVIQNGTFQNLDDGFTVQVPSGWVVQDINNTHFTPINSGVNLESSSSTTLAIICPQDEALPGIGRGVHNCEQSNSAVHVTQYVALDDRPEFAGIGSAASITPDDFLGFLILELQAEGNSDIRVLNGTDITIPVMTNPEDPNNTETRMVSAKQVELTYNKNGNTPQDTRAYYLLALQTILFNAGPGEDQLVTGYKISYEGPAATRPTGGPSMPVQQMFNSFKIIGSSATSTINRINILEGSAIQGNPDYYPEVLIATKGDEISVVNQDTVPHTVTSGTSPTDPNAGQMFDTSLINGGESGILSLALVPPGEYEYHCMVHPYMTGNIKVN